MTTIHDMGGVHGFGTVVPEADEPMFHAEWEKRVLAVTLACGATGSWTLDASRFARESLPPAQYVTSSYYQIWYAALVELLKANGLISEDDLAAGHAVTPAKPVTRILKADAVEAALAKGGPVDRPATAEPRFAVGDRVRTRVTNPATHTRLPRYARGRVGIIHRRNGFHVFPDSNAVGTGENPQWLYNVRFEAETLWGADAEPRSAVHMDLWESYIEPEQAE
ncbi:MAG: nitrile hydratase subunit beta [Hyphomicrobiales bacterium]|nr:MAG: nitrile hydratase subunit beta [Hyphomicrobiales bacterium]